MPALDQHLAVLEHCASIASAHLSPALADDPRPLLAAVAKALVDTAESPLLGKEDKEAAESACHYLGERLAAVCSLRDQKQGKVAEVSYYPAGGRRGPARTLLFDVAKSFGRKVPLTKLVELDEEVRPYLAALMVAAMAKAGKPLVVPQSLVVDRRTDQEFEAVLQAMAGQQYHHYGPLGTTVGVPGLESSGDPWQLMARRESIQKQQLEATAETTARLNEALGYLRMIHESMAMSGYQPAQGGQMYADGEQASVAGPAVDAA